MDNRYVLQICYHCGNEGLLKIKSSFKNRYNDYVDNDICGWYEDEYITLVCPVCNEITFIKKSTSSYCENQDGTYSYDQETLYPNVKANKIGVPKNIVSAFEAAKKVQKIDDSICALSLRRVLELICIQENATGENLNLKVKDLVSRNILPKTFDETCRQIRLIGNEGAHREQISIPKKEINNLIDFIDSIINYLYVIPEKLNRMQKNRKNT